MTGANADQIQFWNSEPGRKWVATPGGPRRDIGGGDRRAAWRPPGRRRASRCSISAAGPVAPSFALAETGRAGGRVLGLDVWSRCWRARRSGGGSSGPRTSASSSPTPQERRFEPGSFDLAASRFGVMFFADPVAAFRNIGGALRPGGRAAFVAWAGPERNPWFTLPLQAAVARLGPVAPTPPDAPGPMAFRNIDRVRGLLRAAGFAGAEGEEVAVDLHHSGGMPAALRLVLNVGPVARMLRERGGSDEDQAAILEAVRASFAPYVGADGIRVPAVLNVFAATRE